LADHAFLSASAGDRWLHCPPSAMLCAQEEDLGSPYAQEGSDAHALCEFLLNQALGREAADPTGNLTWYNAEMQEAAEGYVSWVLDQIAEAKTLCNDPLICVEQKVDFSVWVPEGFGTADVLIVADDLLFVTDFKYGLGQLVTAAGQDGNGNTQLKCYALGALDTFGDLYEIRRIRLSVYQPRRGNVDSFDLTKADLLKWADEALAPAARLAYEGKGDFAAGEHCRFCKVRASCRARADSAAELAKYEFAEPPTLSEKEIADILPRVDILVAWAEDVKKYALDRALSGVQYPGLKLVAGRSNRKYADDAAVAKIVSEAGFDPWEKKVLGITAMTQQLGKKRFNELLKDLIIKPEGKPVLVPVSDPRPELNNPYKDFSCHPEPPTCHPEPPRVIPRFAAPGK